MMLKKTLLLFFFLEIVLLCNGCGAKKNSSEKEFYAAKKTVKDWTESFSDETVISLKYPNPGNEVLRINQLFIGKANNFVIPDPKNFRFLFFDSVGNFIRSVGKKGQGPGEFLLPVGALDQNDNLLVYDLSSRRVTIFQAPSYETSSSFNVNSHVTLFFPDSSGNIVLYTPYNKQLLSKFNAKGELITQTFEPNDEKLRLFMGRIQSGGIAPAVDNKSFFFIFPEEYALYHYDLDFNVLQIIKGSSSNTYEPSAKSFPVDLSPTGFSPRHARWWDSFMHVARVYALSKELVGITVYESNVLDIRKFYLNISSTNGQVYAEGLLIPHDGSIVAAKQGKVYVVTNATISEDGSEKPLVLRSYVIRNDFVQ